MSGPQTTLEWVAAFRVLAALADIPQSERKHVIREALEECARRDKAKR